MLISFPSCIFIILPQWMEYRGELSPVYRLNLYSAHQLRTVYKAAKCSTHSTSCLYHIAPLLGSKLTQDCRLTNQLGHVATTAAPIPGSRFLTRWEHRRIIYESHSKSQVPEGPLMFILILQMEPELWVCGRIHRTLLCSRAWPGAPVRPRHWAEQIQSRYPVLATPECPVSAVVSSHELYSNQ